MCVKIIGKHYTLIDHRLLTKIKLAKTLKNQTPASPKQVFFSALFFYNRLIFTYKKTKYRKILYFVFVTNVDSLDWKDYGVDSIINTVCNHNHLGNGSIILCHNGAKYTAQALETMIQTLQAEGYEFVPLSELIIRENYHMNVEGRQIAD